MKTANETGDHVLKHAANFDHFAAADDFAPGTPVEDRGCGSVYSPCSPVEVVLVAALLKHDRERRRLDWWGIGKGVVLGTLLGMAVVGVVAMPFEAAMVGLAVAGVLTLACMLVGGMCAEAGRRMGIVSSGQ